VTTFLTEFAAAVTGVLIAELMIYMVTKLVTYWSLLRFGPATAGKLTKVFTHGRKGEYDEMVETITGVPFDVMAEDWVDYLGSALRGGQPPSSTGQGSEKPSTGEPLHLEFLKREEDKS